MKKIFIFFTLIISFTAVAQTKMDSLFYHVLILRLGEDYRYYGIRSKEEFICDLKSARYIVQELSTGGMFSDLRADFLQFGVDITTPLYCFDPKVREEPFIFFTHQVLRLIIVNYRGKIYRISGFHQCDIFELIATVSSARYYTKVKYKKEDFLYLYWIENIDMELLYKEFRKRKFSTDTYEFYVPPNKQESIPNTNDSINKK